MSGTDGTWHANDSVDQFSARARRHRFVERVERGLVEPLARDERLGMVGDTRGFGHDLGFSFFGRPAGGNRPRTE